MILLRGIAVWVVIILAETVHGVARTLFLEPRVGDFRARQIGVFTASLIILAIALGFARWLRPCSARHLLGVGPLWLFLTLAFEVLLGRFVMGYSWARLTSDYNLRQGGLCRSD